MKEKRKKESQFSCLKSAPQPAHILNVPAIGAVNSLIGIGMLIMSAVSASSGTEPFGIEVVDRETGRGVPLITLETPDRKVFVTDSAGWVAIDDPGLWGENVYFQVKITHGYEHPSDGFGYRGRAFRIEAGGRGILELERENLAERLYRVTGAGIYEHTVRLGEAPPLKHPLLNAQVAGSDSTLATLYRDRIHWFWGDTDRISYPLGNFHTTGGTSLLPEEGGLDPEEGVNIDYYTREDGFTRPMARMPGDGPTWLGGLTVLRDSDDRPRMYATYTKIRGSLQAYEWGTVLWNDQKEVFEKVSTFTDDFPATHSQEHTFHHAGDDGTEYVYFGNPFPLTRVEATPEAYIDRSRYESFTCLVEGTNADDKKLDRDSEGRLRYSWKKNTPTLRQSDQRRLIDAGLIEAQEAQIRLRDIETGRQITGHTGSVAWNDFRNRWIMIFVELGGEASHLGDVWYAEADEPTGPWVDAHHILTHEEYSFYNPRHHPFFDKEGGRIIFFEGTYTNSFSGNPLKTPRYDYNQIMYKLDLARLEISR